MVKKKFFLAVLVAAVTLLAQGCADQSALSRYADAGVAAQVNSAAGIAAIKEGEAADLALKNRAVLEAECQALGHRECLALLKSQKRASELRSRNAELAEAIRAAYARRALEEAIPPKEKGE